MHCFESKVLVTLNENGRRHCITKHELLIKQLLNKGIGGNIPAVRTYLDYHQIASEKVALQEEAAQANEAERRSDVRNLTDQEMHQKVLELREQKEQKK